MKIYTSNNNTMETETIIFSNHNLDTSDIQKLAEKLATSLKLNIEICEYENGETLQNTIGGNLESEEMYYLNTNDLGASKYVLEMGEAALLISDEIITYDLPIYTPLDTFNPTQLDNTHTVVIKELKALGATEIVYAEDSETARSLNQSNITFDEFKAAVTKNSNYKIIH